MPRKKKSPTVSISIEESSQREGERRLLIELIVPSPQTELTEILAKHGAYTRLTDHITKSLEESVEQYRSGAERVLSTLRQTLSETNS